MLQLVRRYSSWPNLWDLWIDNIYRRIVRLSIVFDLLSIEFKRVDRMEEEIKKTKKKTMATFWIRPRLDLHLFVVTFRVTRVLIIIIVSPFFFLFFFLILYHWKSCISFASVLDIDNTYVHNEHDNNIWIFFLSKEILICACISVQLWLHVIHMNIISRPRYCR